MTPWQILQASRAALAARDFYSQRGGGSLAAAAAAAATVDGCSSFYMSGGKVALQELNGRLAWYLQQVHDLEASNQRLEIQIQRELDRKCPQELRHLDKHLRAVCLLQQRIHEDRAVQAQLKLQLLNAELNISGLRLRCDHEGKRGAVVQEQLNQLWQLGEELQVQLPQLHDHLNHLSGQMMEMQLRHQENTRDLQAQISDGITMDIMPSQSLALTQQLDHLRWTNDMLFTETLGNTWCGNQVPGVQMSLMRPAVAFNHHEDLEFFQLELEQLRRSAMILEAELTQLEAQNEVLEASGMELENTLDHELLVLEEGEDLLYHDLNSVLQASAQKAEDHYILLGVKNQLENEIHDYRRLLEGLEQQWVPGFSSRFSNPSGTPTFPSNLTHNITVKQMVSLPGRRIYMKEVQPPCQRFTTVNQTSVTPAFEPVVSKIQSIKIQDLGSTGSTSQRAGDPRISQSVTHSDLRSENRPSVSVGGQPEDQKSSVICVQEIQSPDKGEVLRKSIENLSVSDTRFKSEGQTGTDECLVESHSVTIRTSTKPNQAPQILTRLSLYDLSKQTAAAEESKEMTTAGFPQQNSPEDVTNTPDQDHGQILHVTVETEKAACETATGDTVKSSCISVEAAGSISGPVRLTFPLGTAEQTTISVLKPDQPSCQKSDAEQRKVMETTAEGSSSATASAITSDSSGHSETKVEIKMFPSEGLDVQENSESFTFTQTGREGCLLDSKTETNTAQQETNPKTRLTQGSTEDQVLGQKVPISLKKQSEAGIVAVTVPCVSGSESQSSVSVEATLVHENQVEKLVEKVEVQAVVSGGGQSSALQLHKALADEDKQADDAATEALHYKDVSINTKCETSSETFIRANGSDTKIEPVVTKAQLEQNPEPTSIPHLEEAGATEQAHLQEKSAAVVMVQSSYPSVQGEFLSFESFQSLRCPRPRSNTLWMVVIPNSSEDVEDQGREEKQELHVAEKNMNIGKVENKNILKKEAEKSQSLSASQCLSDRHTMTLVTEKHSAVLDATNSFGLAAPESRQRLNGLLQQEETLPPNGTSEGVFTGATGKTKVDQDQGVQSAGQLDQQEVSSSQADVKGHYGELSQVQTVSISGQNEEVLTNQTPVVKSGISQTASIAEDNKVLIDQTFQLQTVSLPAQREEVITDQTELPTVNIINDSEKVLKSKTVDIPMESETVVTDQTVCVLEERERVLTNQTELLSVNTLEPMENILTDQPVQLKVVSVTEEPEKVVTAELKTVTVPDQTEEVIIDQTELLSVNRIKDSEKVLQSKAVSITEEAGEVSSAQTEHLQTFGIPEESKTAVKDQPAEVQTMGVPEQREEIPTNQTEVLTVNIIQPSEKVFTDQPVQLQVVSITKETEKVLPNQAAELQSATRPVESETVLTDQTELQTAKTVDHEKVLTDQPVQLQVVSKTEETEKVLTDQTIQLRTFIIPEESETLVTDQTAEAQSVSSPEENEQVQTNHRTSLDDTTGGSASSRGEETVVLTAKVPVNDHKDPKLNEGRTAANLIASLSKHTTSNGRISPRKPQESRTVEKSTSKEVLINESRLGFHSKSEKISTLIHRAAERSSKVETGSSGVSSEKGRFSRENWIVYGGGVGRERSLNRTRSADSLSTVTPSSQVRSSSAERKDQVVDGGSPQRSNGTKGGEGPHSAENMVTRPKGSQQTNLAGRAGRFDLEEWKVYGGGSPGHIRSWKSSDSLGKDEAVAVLTKIAVPAASAEARRLGSAASDEWRVYGGSTERISKRCSDKSFPKTVKEEVPNQRGSPEPLGDLGETVVSAESAGRVSNWVSSSVRPNADKEVTPAASGENPPTTSSGSQGPGRLGSAHSGEWRVYGGSASRLSRSTSADMVGVQASSSKRSTGSAGSSSGMSSGSHRISTSGRYASTGSVERKPVYSPASVRKNSAGSGSKLSGQSGARISNSSRPGTTSATGGRVIISSSRPIRSTGSGVGDNKERISVCKMAALSMAAAGRGRGQDQQKQEAASAPLLQQWLTSGGHQKANHERLDSSVVQQK